MFKPSVDDMLAGKQSRYSLVIAVAKRAREISNEYKEKEILLDEKPVLLAVEDFKNHKYEILEKDDEEIEAEDELEENRKKELAEQGGQSDESDDNAEFSETDMFNKASDEDDEG